jgi:hypothetical protein
MRTMTGIPSLKVLNCIVDICKDVVKDSKEQWSMRDKVILTMTKLKTNLDFAALAVIFKTSFSSIKKYFVETIQLLAQVSNEHHEKKNVIKI